MVKRVDVAAAVITRPDGSFLLGQRGEETFYPGYWEFPGGKVESGETPHQAVVRELHEELGITVHRAYPWLMREHIYEHAHVKLHFFEIPEWSGELQDNVHAALAWQHANQVQVGPMLPANGPIMKALRLPRQMAITHAHQIGVQAQLSLLDKALARGARLVQIRESALDAASRQAFTRDAVAQCHAAGALAFVNGDIAAAAAAEADGVHLSALQLGALGARPDFEWVGASCHTREELERAAEQGYDYAVLGPVAPTLTHPEHAGIGWREFERLAAGLPMPVFAIGGLSSKDMDRAQSAGAHGIAAIRAAWAPAA